MYKKQEQELDTALMQYGIYPTIYHFRENVDPFTGITIIDNRLSWTTARKVIDIALTELVDVMAYLDLPLQDLADSTPQLLTIFKSKNIHGIAVNDRKHQFNRQLNRIISKGRFLKYLRKTSKNKTKFEYPWEPVSIT